VTDRRQRVLVVDDAANLRELLSIVLDLEDDFTVVAAVATTREALDRAEALRPDVVLLEIAVPARDGVDAVVELRRLLPDARIVVFTGYEHEDLVRRALAGGADGYVEKGTSVLRLVDQLRQLRDRDRDEDSGRGRG
jgi:DNA-binding NarL/FixJ family response regulator